MYGKCGDKILCQILFCQFYLIRSGFFEHPMNALLFLEQIVETHFEYMIRDIEVRNSIAKKHFWFFQFPVKSG